MIRRKAVFSAMLVVVVAATGGCSDAPYKLAPVHGTVTIDGRPMTSGKVMFAPIKNGPGIEAGKPAIGAIHDDGSFELSTYQDGDGAVVGEHWVTVFGADSHTVLTQAEHSSSPDNKIPAFDRLNITEKQLVKAGIANEINIALTTADVTAYGISGE